MRAILVLGAVFLSGCAATVPPSRLEPPAAHLLARPAPLKDPKAGDDLVKSHVELRRQYSTESGKLARLQRYVRTILGR